MSKPISQQSNPIEPLTDRFGRRVEYLRLSVTDRCDFRCVYCMEEEMTFVPRSQVLSLEEMALVARVFVELGVKKIRLTGGEPLIRQGIIQLCEQISALPGLHELVLTTNGSQLTKLAAPLKRAGVKRLNISLDSLNAAKFKELTRTGDLQHVLEGIDAARAQGFDQIKLNAVILKGRNDEEVLPLVNYALSRGLDISFIEEMPLGIIQEHSRKESFISSESLREMIEKEHVLRRSEKKDLAGGPSRYWNVEGFDSRIGFISPHSENFCADCNRVRVTTEGRLLLCLGNEHSVDLREVMRSSDHDPVILKQALVDSMQIKPEKHFFDLDQKPDIIRFMNATGG